MHAPLCIAIALALFASPEPRGERPHAGVADYRGWGISSLELTGLDGVTARELRKGLALAGKDAALYEKELAGDIDRIRLFMARRGYPYSGVAVLISPQKEKRAVALTLEVDPGRPVIVESIETRGVPGDLLAGKASGRLPLKRNKVFTEENFASSRTMVLDGLLEAGHARAGVEASAALLDSGRVAVRIDAAPGPVYYMGRFTASGASADLNELALISLNIDAGERFEPKSVDDARDNLSALGLYRQIRISLEDCAADSLAMRVELQERKHKTIELGGGYWSDDGISGRIMWRHMNLFRRGRGASAEASYTQYRRNGEVAAWWPALWGRMLTGAVRLGYDDISEDGYEKTAPAIGLSLSYFHTRRMASSLGYTIERASYTILTTESESFEDPSGPAGYFHYRLVRDGTDDRVQPRRGTYAWVRLEYGPPGGISDCDHVLAECSGTLHAPFTGRFGVAANLRLGAGKPLGSSDALLPDRRLYAGGSTSHRGFNRHRLGPLDENGLPFGGEMGMTGFVELRFPLVWKFDGALFWDWGQVWRNRDEFTWETIESAVGPALRLMTPVGPLRFDFGYRLTDFEPDEPGFVFHFAIGYPM